MKTMEIVSAARMKTLSGQRLIDSLFPDFIELHGDKRFGDDAAIIGGLAKIDGRSVTVIAIDKGKDTKERIKRNFGSPHPEGYRKALRLMKQAEKFRRPVLCFIDTSGAYCGIGAEERGQGQAIAENLYEMMTLKTPVISVLVGEGGSGGALALAVSDEVWMMQNSVYSVISPEGCASILWKDSAKVADAADCLKLTAQHLLGFGIVERIIPEDGQEGSFLKEMLSGKLEELCKINVDKLTEKRYNRFRAIGIYEEEKCL